MILALLFIGIGMCAGTFLYLIGFRGIVIWLIAFALCAAGYYL